MRTFRNVFLGAALMAGMVGCTTRQDGQDIPKDKAPRKVTKKADPVRPAPMASLKAAKDLKAPEGVEVTDSAMPKSYWSSYEDARVGDVAEYEFPVTGMKSKMEVVDLGDRAVMVVSEATVTLEGKETKSRSAMRMVFTEPEPDEAKGEDKMTIVRRADKRQFTVNGKAVYSDTVSESSRDGKVLARSWSSKELPSAVLETQDGEGKATMRLVRYQRGK